MTIAQYLTHIWQWLKEFPRWSEYEHDFAGPVTSLYHQCLVCGRKDENK